MPTTTIRLPAELKARVAVAAERAGVSPHSFIVEAIASKAERDERCRDMADTADRRYASIAANGQTIPWSEMQRYLQARVSGVEAKRPAPRKLGR